MKINTMIELLKLPIPEGVTQMLEKKSKKSGKVSLIPYVSWHRLCDLLDQRIGAGNWDWTIKEMLHSGDRLVLRGAITLFGEDRIFTMEATGSESADVGSFGNPSSNAEASCFRRCLAKIGLGRSLWEKEMNKKKLIIALNQVGIVQGYHFMFSKDWT